MNYTDILIYMRHEVTLMAIIIVLFIYDLAAGKRGRSRLGVGGFDLLDGNHPGFTVADL